MPKIKTKKKAAKRFKITGTGKVMAQATGRRHLLSDKNSKKKRILRKEISIEGKVAENIKQVLPYV